MAHAAVRARELAAELEAVVRASGPLGDGTAVGPTDADDDAGTARAPAPDLTTVRRAVPHCPPGMRTDRPEALDAMLRTRGVVLVVDGYNVSMLGWPDATVAEQRDRLIAALSALHLKLRCDVVVVFDGSDVEGVQPPRRPGVRVVFSSDGREGRPGGGPGGGSRRAPTRPSSWPPPTAGCGARPRAPARSWCPPRPCSRSCADNRHTPVRSSERGGVRSGGGPGGA